MIWKVVNKLHKVYFVIVLTLENVCFTYLIYVKHD